MASNHTVNFFTYKSDLNKIIGLIPKQIEKSSKISVGSLSLEIDRTAKISGNVELAEIIKKLSEKGIRKLLTFSSISHAVLVHSKAKDTNEEYFTLPSDIDVVLELEKNGLIKGNSHIDKNLTVEDFISLFKTFPSKKVAIYMSPEGFSMDEKYGKFTEKITQNRVFGSQLRPDELAQLNNYTIQLSDQGKKAYEIIVHVVAEQINSSQ